MSRRKKTKSGIALLTAATAVLCMSFAFNRPASPVPSVTEPISFTNTSTTVPASVTTTRALLYDQLELANLGLSREAFDYAIQGYDQLLSEGKLRKDHVLSIADFSLPSGKKRLFVIDLESGELLFNTYVSHGRNSGKALATNFSNQFNSFKSSLGFYITSGTYNGKHGQSLRLEGEEAGINDNAMSRGIVMHSAAYVGAHVAAQQGYIGRSQGCPALPENLYKPIIETIKNGSCLFIYSADAHYLANSRLIGKGKGVQFS